MSKIPENFSGYLNIDQDVFAYTASKHIITLLPAASDQEGQDEMLERLRSRNSTSSEYLFGTADAGYKVAVLRNGEIKGDIFHLTPYIHFATPIIVKASGNADGFYSRLTEKWDTFHSITFWGGNINALHNPQIAVARPDYKRYTAEDYDGSDEIKLRPWDDYTQSIELKIDGIKAQLTISISRRNEKSDSKDIGVCNLGKLNAFIRLSFDKPQGFMMIQKCYTVVRSLVAILTTQNNISFNVYLSQRGADKKLFPTAECEIFDHFENYSVKEWHQVVQIRAILNCIPELIQMILNSDVDFLLALLPEDNRKANQISITNVQDLCTALEIIYDWNKRDRAKDVLIEDLKRIIKDTITKFSNVHTEIDPSRETTINSSFQYLDYTSKQKVLTLYDENKENVDIVISKWGLPPINENTVGAFVKLRNNKTHSGTFEWGDSADIYLALLALVYICLFKKAGLPDQNIQGLVDQLF